MTAAKFFSSSKKSCSAPISNRLRNSAIASAVIQPNQEGCLSRSMRLGKHPPIPHEHDALQRGHDSGMNPDADSKFKPVTLSRLPEP